MKKCNIIISVTFAFNNGEIFSNIYIFSLCLLLEPAIPCDTAIKKTKPNSYSLKGEKVNSGIGMSYRPASLRI